MNESRLVDYLDHVSDAARHNLDVVWETVQTALPQLLRQLPAVREDAQAWLHRNPGA
jgi:uncharacterized protein with HEPN domain